ncbi:MAG: hypothetical protein QMC87_06220 [Methanothermobacter thermautotrophicus]|nr:hypothetical protein [Methanothermobacter thermautotrophicus]
MYLEKRMPIMLIITREIAEINLFFSHHSSRPPKDPSVKEEIN